MQVWGPWGQVGALMAQASPSPRGGESGAHTPVYPTGGEPILGSSPARHPAGAIARPDGMSRCSRLMLAAAMPWEGRKVHLEAVREGTGTRPTDLVLCWSGHSGFFWAPGGVLSTLQVEVPGGLQDGSSHGSGFGPC